MLFFKVLENYFWYKKNSGFVEGCERFCKIFDENVDCTYRPQRKTGLCNLKPDLKIFFLFMFFFKDIIMAES